MKKLILPLVVAAMAATATLAQNRKINFEEGDLATVLAKAKAENKPVFVDAYTTWCGPCKWMDKTVFTNDSVADYYNAHFINYKLDMEKGEGITFRKQHDINAFPSLVFVDAGGQMLHRSIGARPPQPFIALGQEAANPETRLTYFDNQYARGKRDPEFIARYVRMRAGAGLPADEVMDLYMANVKDSEFTSRTNWNLINWYLADLNSATYSRFLKNRQAFSKLYSPDSVDQKLLSLHEPRLMKVASKGNPVEFERVRDDLAKLKLKNSEPLILQAEATLYDKMKDTKSYTATVEKLVETYYLKDAHMLNNYAWAYYEKIDQKPHLQKAEKWAAAAAKLEPSFPILDTHASVLYKLGRKAEAKAVAERAIAEGKKGGTDVTETEELLKKINALK